MEELTQDIDELTIKTPRRTPRKRSYTEPPPTPPPKRKSKPSTLTEDKIKNFYMNKTCARFARQALETIYEDPLCNKQGSTLFFGTAKIKRKIVMHTGVASKHKKICRKKKLKRLGIKWVKPRKISDEDFRLIMLESFKSESLTETNKNESEKVCDSGSTSINV